MTNYKLDNLNSFIDAAFKDEKLVLNASGDKYAQTPRNNFRKELMAALAADLGLAETHEGFLLEIPHEELGTVVVELKCQVKEYSLLDEFTVEELAEDFAKTKEAKAQAKAEKAERALKEKEYRKKMKMAKAVEKND